MGLRRTTKRSPPSSDNTSAIASSKRDICKIPFFSRPSICGLGQGRNVVEVIFVFFEKLNLRSFDHAAVAHKRHFTISEALGNLVDLAGKCLGI